MADESYLLKYGFPWCILGQLRISILIIDIVSHSDKLASFVRTRQQNHCHAYCIFWWDFSRIWGVSLCVCECCIEIRMKKGELTEDDVRMRK